MDKAYEKTTGIKKLLGKKHIEKYSTFPLIREKQSKITRTI